MAYIKEYSDLNQKELCQLGYKRKFKAENPDWDDSMVVLRYLVAQRLPDHATVLDAGCGNGNFVIDELRSKIARAVGIDVNQEVTAKNICLDEIVFGRLEKLPFADGEFDAVISLWVLEHISEPQKIFSEIVRVLKPGGFFAFVTPNKKSWLIMLRRLMNQKIADHLVDRLYGRHEEDIFSVEYKVNSVSEIQALANTVGLKVERLSENPDPTYTSFGPMSYRVSSSMSRLPFSLFREHIIGILRKLH